MITTFEVPVIKTHRDNQHIDLYYVKSSNLTLMKEYTEFGKDKSTGNRIATKMSEWNLHIETALSDNIDINFSAPSNSKEFKIKYIKSIEKPSDDGDTIAFVVYGLYTSDQEDL